MSINMKKFKFYWKGSSSPNEGEGVDVADAFRRLGFGGGAINAVDYWEETTNSNKEKE